MGLIAGEVSNKQRWILFLSLLFFMIIGPAAITIIFNNKVFISTSSLILILIDIDLAIYSGLRSCLADSDADIKYYSDYANIKIKNYRFWRELGEQ